MKEELTQPFEILLCLFVFFPQLLPHCQNTQVFSYIQLRSIQPRKDKFWPLIFTARSTRTTFTKISSYLNKKGRIFTKAI